MIMVFFKINEKKSEKQSKYEQYQNFDLNSQWNYKKKNKKRILMKKNEKTSQWNIRQKKNFYENSGKYYLSYAKNNENYFQLNQYVKEFDESKKANNAENLKKSNNYESIYFINFELIVNCRKYDKEFFFNNKFHKHIKICKI